MVEDSVAKMKRITRLLQRTVGQGIDFREIAESLADEIDADVYVLDKDGKILGQHSDNSNRCETIMNAVSLEKRFSDEFNQWLSAIGHTLANYREDGDSCVFNKEIECGLEEETLMVIPVRAGGKRLGTLVFVMLGNEFSQGDILMGECGATAVGMEILQTEVNKKNKDQRRKNKAQMAIDVLSFSELKAIKYIFDEIGGDRGFLVASKVADTIGITRSVIVNALRKLESAGIIESKSLGMKGTYIRALNYEFLEALEHAI